MESHCVDRAAVALLLKQTAAGLHVPQPPSFIEAGSPHVAPHGMEGNPAKPSLMTLSFLHQFRQCNSRQWCAVRCCFSQAAGVKVYSLDILTHVSGS